MMEDFLCGVEDLGRRMETLYDEHAPKAPSLPPLSSWFATEQNKSDKQPKPAKKPKRVNLASVNPSLRTVGLPVVERLMPRYLVKAGLACERMQHAGLPGPFIANVLEATFGTQTEAQLSEVFHYFDADGGGYLDEDEFIAIAPLLAEDVPGDSLAALMAAIDTDCNGTVRRDADGSWAVHSPNPNPNPKPQTPTPTQPGDVRRVRHLHARVQPARRRARRLARNATRRGGGGGGG